MLERILNDVGDPGILQILYKIKKASDLLMPLRVAGAGLEPTTFGL